ncbi:Gfo/Idh/MocA family oxidoreductase [Reyranella sp.]|uniref:Gfo/Idh/MocA family protein n=1 Tax=Reyranella sp. TaxID=1929291 RepID=UPI0025DA524F|nr:Gfo/Idh/MocA family oxidoreductase [Reyranella sp.]
MVRIGILGAGAMGAVHASAYAGMDDVEVVGVSARSLDRARLVADICKAKPFDDPRLLIESADIDAIDVCLPSAIHGKFVVSALNCGKHVFCETPMALGMSAAQGMRAAARKANRLLQIGLLMRSVGAYEHVKAVVTSGEHGRLISLSTWRLSSYLHPDAPDRKSHYTDPTTELMTFDLDVVQWLMGAPERLSASGDGDITALLDYGDGRHATVTASGLMPTGFPFTVGFRALFERAVFGLETVFSEMPPRSTFTIATGNAPAKAVAISGRDPYVAELRHFVDCIAGKADPSLLDADRAIEALNLSLATQRALAEGGPVTL